MTEIENITVSDVSEHECELTITVPKAVVNKEYEHTLVGIQRVASRPGFRPGKIPRSMVQSLYGAEIKKTLSQKLMENSLKVACKERKLTPISEPKFEALDDCEREKAFTYRAQFQKKPSVLINNFEGLSITIKNFVFGPKDIEDELDNLREAHATVASCQDRQAIGVNDAVICESEVFIDGERKEEHCHKDYMIAVFDKTVPENVRNALIGKSIGDKVAVSYTIPSDHQDEEVKGKLCEMNLVINDFKERILPALDDDFAKDISDKFHCLSDLKESINARLTLMARRRNEYFRQDAILHALVQNNPLLVPPVLIERMALHLINRELEGLPKDVAEDAVKNRWATMWESVQSHAQFRVKSQLLLEALIEKLDIKASDEELAAFRKKGKEVDREDATYSLQVEKLLAMVEKASSITFVDEPLFG
ncbi:MAG TPA: trigger factor [Myxococcota bacterium]|nr:trigger factor [Myxococcota bacterium]